MKLPMAGSTLPRRQVSAGEIYYADDASSIEPENTPTPSVSGLAAIIQKGNYFQQAFTFYGNTVSNPLILGNYFTVHLVSDVTQNESGHRMMLDKLVVYRVRDGKVFSMKANKPCRYAKTRATTWPLERVDAVVLFWGGGFSFLCNGSPPYFLLLFGMVSVHRGIVVSLLVAIILLMTGVMALLWVSHSRDQRYQNELQDVRRELVAKENELRELRRQLRQTPESPAALPIPVLPKPLRPALPVKTDTANDGWSQQTTPKTGANRTMMAVSR